MLRSRRLSEQRGPEHFSSLLVLSSTFEVSWYACKCAITGCGYREMLSCLFQSQEVLSCSLFCLLVIYIYIKRCRLGDFESKGWTMLQTLSIKAALCRCCKQYLYISFILHMRLAARPMGQKEYHMPSSNETLVHRAISLCLRGNSLLALWASLVVAIFQTRHT
jgi:hypothetical protein